MSESSGTYPIINQNSGSYRILYGEGDPPPAPELPKHLPMTLEVDRYAETHPLRPSRSVASLG